MTIEPNNKEWKLLGVEEGAEPFCWHCGTKIRYTCWIENTGGDRKAVGRTCCHNFLKRSQIKEIDLRMDDIKRAKKCRKQYDIWVANGHDPKPHMNLLLNNYGENAYRIAGFDMKDAGR